MEGRVFNVFCHACLGLCAVAYIARLDDHSTSTLHTSVPVHLCLELYNRLEENSRWSEYQEVSQVCIRPSLEPSLTKISLRGLLSSLSDPILVHHCTTVKHGSAL